MEIQVRGLFKKFSQETSAIKILTDVNMTFKQPQTFAIIGVSGSGKSTFMHLLCGLEKPDAGTIKIIDQQVDRPLFGIVFQHDFLIEELTAVENVALAGIAVNFAPSVAQQKALKLLEMVNLSAHANAIPSTLSGGQRVRVSLCRALIAEPHFLLADEPTSSLDEHTAAQVLSLLFELQERFKMGIILCTHDLKMANQMQHIFKLEQGELSQLK